MLAKYQPVYTVTTVDDEIFMGNKFWGVAWPTKIKHETCLKQLIRAMKNIQVTWPTKIKCNKNLTSELLFHHKVSLFTVYSDILGIGKSINIHGYILQDNQLNMNKKQKSLKKISWH